VRRVLVVAVLHAVVAVGLPHAPSLGWTFLLLDGIVLGSWWIGASLAVGLLLAVATAACATVGGWIANDADPVLWGLAVWAATAFLYVPWALGFGALRRAGLGPARAATVAAALVSVAPLSGIAAALGGTRPIPVRHVAAAWLHTEGPALERQLAWVFEGRRDRLFAAGNDDYRERDCLSGPDGCPPLPPPSVGRELGSSLSCSLRLGRCRHASQRTDGAWWVIADLDGRFVDAGHGDVVPDRLGRADTGPLLRRALGAAAIAVLTALGLRATRRDGGSGMSAMRG
jgi:hypothetical protein